MQQNLVLRTFSVRAIWVLKVKNVLILTVIYYINHKLVIGDLVLKVKQVFILMVLKARFDCMFYYFTQNFKAFFTLSIHILSKKTPKYIIQYHVEYQTLNYHEVDRLFPTCFAINELIKRSFFSFVAEPRTEILGDQERFVDSKSSLNLTCLVISPNPPAYIFWKLTDKVKVLLKTINHFISLCWISGLRHQILVSW